MDSALQRFPEVRVETGKTMALQREEMIGKTTLLTFRPLVVLPQLLPLAVGRLPPLSRLSVLA